MYLLFIIMFRSVFFNFLTLWFRTVYTILWLTDWLAVMLRFRFTSCATTSVSATSAVSRARSLSTSWSRSAILTLRRWWCWCKIIPHHHHRHHHTCSVSSSRRSWRHPAQLTRTCRWRRQGLWRHHSTLAPITCRRLTAPTPPHCTPAMHRYVRVCTHQSVLHRVRQNSDTRPSQLPTCNAMQNTTYLYCSNNVDVCS